MARNTLDKLATYAVAWIKAARELGLTERFPQQNLVQITDSDPALVAACFEQAMLKTGISIRPEDTFAIAAMLEEMLREEAQERASANVIKIGDYLPLEPIREV